MALNSYLSINTLNVNGPNGPNAPIKKHKVSEWIKKQNKTKQNKTHVYAVYNGVILDLKIPTD